MCSCGNWTSRQSIIKICCSSTDLSAHCSTCNIHHPVKILGSIMKNYGVHVLLGCVLAVQWVSVSQASPGALAVKSNFFSPVSAVFHADLRTGLSSRLPEGIAWYSKLTSSVTNCACDRQGVLKLTFSRKRVRAQVKLTFEHSTGWTFNVGDSSTNNGYGGDSGTQKYDAEVHSIGNTIFFYGRDKPTGGSFGLLLKEKNFVAINPHTTVTLNVADELATADNGVSFLEINSYKMFGLRGQADSGGVNRDVYLAMNRVVDGAYRSGTGLCKVSVQFFSTYL